VTIDQAIKKVMKTYVDYPPRNQKFRWLREQLQKEGFNLQLPTGN